MQITFDDDQVTAEIEVTEARVLAYGQPDNFLQDFQWNEPISAILATEQDGSGSKIVAMNDDAKWTYVQTSMTDIRALKMLPASQSSSFITHRDGQDYLIQKNNDDYTTLLKTHRIIDYDWINSETVAVVVQSETMKESSFLLDINSKNKIAISIHPGKTVKRISDDEVAFIDIFSDEYRYIKVYNLQYENSKIITKIPQSVSAFTYAENDRFYIGVEDNIQYFTRDRSAKWDSYINLKSYGITKIAHVEFISPNSCIIQYD